ncbi:MAG: hypothetical protein IM533_17220 [Pseudanabaena sp. M007S1SP1A06QC]|nr:hypothetical protein [Pseudanabaena sp. M007S1SP1A06QC]
MYDIQSSDRPSSPIQPDRLFLQIKQRSHTHHPQNPITYSPHQTAIAHISD